MKKFFTKLCIVIFGMSMTCMLNAQAPEIIWGGPNDPNGSFDGGLNDWTTVGVSSGTPDSAENAVWRWDAEGDAPEGAFWGTRDPIESETVDNGTALFNSDWLTSGGDENNLESGVAPRPHRGELISPTIDCSPYSSVAVFFTQYYRPFQATSTVEVSVDGGPWTAFTVNEEIQTNSETSSSSQLQVDITDIAAGEDSVRIKFAFEGGFYFWIIDDVSLQTLPANDLVAESFFYPVRNFRTPDKVNDCDTMGFSMGIMNSGALDQTNVEIKASILDDSDDVMFSTTESVGTFEAGRIDTFDFQEMYIPDQLDVGIYTVLYEVSSDSTDFFPGDNMISEQFAVTEDMFSKDKNGHDIGYRSSSPPEQWSVANLYQTCPYDANPTDHFDRIFWSFSVSEDDFPTLEGIVVDLWVAKVDREVCANWNDFATDILDPFNHPQISIIGFNSYELSDGTPEGELLDSVLYDYQYLIKEGELRIGAPVESDACYFAGATAPGEMFLGFEEVLDYAPGLVSTVVITSQWFLGGFTGGQDATVRLSAQLDPVNSTIPRLPESAVTLFPNPVQDQLHLEFDLESAQDVTIQISDVTGRSIQTQYLSDVINDTWTSNPLRIQSGTYFLRVIAEEGERTMKFIKQ